MKKLIYILMMLVVPVMAQKGWTPFAGQNWRVGNTANSITYMNGKVGIGLLTPIYNLQVVGSIYSSVGYGSPNGTSSLPAIRFDSEEGMGFYRAGTDQTVFVGGNFGIGVTPAYKLDISGQGRFTDTVRALAYVTTSDIDSKENVTEVRNFNLSNFGNVKPIYFTYKRTLFAQYDTTGAEINSEYVNQMIQSQQVGFSAQEFSREIKGTGTDKVINNSELTVAMWLKIQELEKRIEVLEKK
jgi:hypothetical protein